MIELSCICRVMCDTIKQEWYQKDLSVLQYIEVNQALFVK